MQLDVRVRALMSVEEIKCPHKGLDSGGLCCFLSHAPPCDNCFSNIRNLPRSKAGLKERRKKKEKKKDIKEGFECGAVGALHSPRLPRDGAMLPTLPSQWKYGRAARHCRGPSRWRVLKGKVASSELFLPDPQPALLKWQRSSQEPEQSAHSLVHPCSPPRHNSALQHCG